MTVAKKAITDAQLAKRTVGRPRKGKKPITVWIALDLIAKVDEAAAGEDRTKSAVVGRALEAWFRQGGDDERKS